MTENEAIIQLNFDMEMIRFNPETGENLTLEQIKARNEDNYKTYLADEIAITALVEIQSYRAIGTVEELKSMKENGVLSGVELAQIVAMQMKLKEYQSIGTLDECRTAVERMKPKKPIIKEWCPALCPSCKRILSESRGDGYWQHYTSLQRCECGQRLDWSE